jgi:hypothetical protein
MTRTVGFIWLQFCVAWVSKLTFRYVCCLKTFSSLSVDFLHSHFYLTINISHYHTTWEILLFISNLSYFSIIQFNEIIRFKHDSIFNCVFINMGMPNEEVIKKKNKKKRHMCYKILHLIPDGEMHVKLLLNACCMKQLFQLNKPSQNLTCAWNLRN